MTQVSSSGPELLDTALAFDSLNLLQERIERHAATYAASVRLLKQLALLTLTAAIVLPYLWITGRAVGSEARSAAAAAEEASKRYEAVKRQEADLQPAIQYAARLQSTKDHRQRWLSILHCLEAGVGPSGFVTSVSLRSLPNALETTVTGEAPSLTDANRWLASLRLRPEYRDVAIARVQPAERLQYKEAVRYELRGKVRLQ